MTTPDPARLVDALQRLINARDRVELRATLEADAEVLLTPDAVAMLQAAAETAAARGDADSAAVLRGRAQLVHDTHQDGIAAVWARLETANTQDPSDDLGRLLDDWIATGPTYCDELRFLEAHAARLLTQAAEDRLATTITDATANADDDIAAGDDPATVYSELADLRTYYEILRGARRRTAHLETITAIREAYVDAQGGFSLDIPTWLNAVITRDRELRQDADADAAARARIRLWDEAVAQGEGDATLPAPVLAACYARLASAHHATHGRDQPERQEAAIACYRAALRVYTEERFPIQWALTQHNLGNVYWKRLREDKDANQETAIAYYQAALRVYTEERFPSDHRETATSLGNLLSDRGQIAEAIAWFTSAQRAETLRFAEGTGARSQDLELGRDRRAGAPAGLGLLARVGRWRRRWRWNGAAPARWQQRASWTPPICVASRIPRAGSAFWRRATTISPRAPIVSVPYSLPANPTSCRQIPPRAARHLTPPGKWNSASATMRSGAPARPSMRRWQQFAPPVIPPTSCWRITNSMQIFIRIGVTYTSREVRKLGYSSARWLIGYTATTNSVKGADGAKILATDSALK